MQICLFFFLSLASRAALQANVTVSDTSKRAQKTHSHNSREPTAQQHSERREPVTHMAPWPGASGGRTTVSAPRQASAAPKSTSAVLPVAQSESGARARAHAAASEQRAKLALATRSSRAPKLYARVYECEFACARKLVAARTRSALAAKVSKAKRCRKARPIAASGASLLTAHFCPQFALHLTAHCEQVAQRYVRCLNLGREKRRQRKASRAALVCALLSRCFLGQAAARRLGGLAGKVSRRLRESRTRNSDPSHIRGEQASACSAPRVAMAANRRAEEEE